jgi:hypothetical protein
MQSKTIGVSWLGTMPSRIARVAAEVGVELLVMDMASSRMAWGKLLLAQYSAHLTAVELDVLASHEACMVGPRNESARHDFGIDAMEERGLAQQKSHMTTRLLIVVSPTGRAPLVRWHCAVRACQAPAAHSSAMFLLVATRFQVP